MITEYEQGKRRELEEAFHTMALQVQGEDATPEMRAEFVGANLATMDALFAIREGTEWRGHTDPKEIARAVLRVGNIGE